MRRVFFGTPAFAVPSLEVLLASHEVVAVVTQPDRPALSRCRADRVGDHARRDRERDHDVPDRSGMDTGDVLLTARTPIGPDETAGELAERLSRRG